MNRRLATIALVLVGLAAVAVVVILRPQPLALGFQPGSINYPMMHAIDGGFFEREGLQPAIRIFRSANDALDSLLSGKVFVDAVIPIQNIAAIQKEKPGTLGIVAVLLSDTEHPLDYLVVPATSSVQTPSELAGKCVVVFPGSYSETVTRLAFARLGIHNIAYIKREPSDMARALQSGEADAAILYDPVATQSQIKGWGRIIERGFWERHLLPVMVVGAYTYNRPMAARNPQLARRVFAALEAGILDARKNSEPAKKLILKYLGPYEDILHALPESRVELAREVDPSLVEQTLRLYAEHGIIPEAVSVPELLAQPAEPK